MDSSAVLKDAFGRIGGIVNAAVVGLDGEHLALRVAPEANSIAWLVWHLTRVQDDHVSELAGQEQAWVAAGWHERFGMPADPSDTGYGHSTEQVSRLRPRDGSLLLGYYDAVAEQTFAYLDTVDEGDLDRVIDTSWTPPVTVGVRLVSVLGDSLQHAGQAAFVRGIVDRRA